MDKSMEKEMKSTYEMMCALQKMLDEHEMPASSEEIQRALGRSLQMELCLASTACRLAEWDDKELNKLGKKALQVLGEIYELLAGPEGNWQQNSSGTGALADLLVLFCVRLSGKLLPGDFEWIFSLSFARLLRGAVKGLWFD